MKKICLWLICVSLIAGMTACAQDGNVSSSSDSSSVASESSTGSAAEGPGADSSSTAQTPYQQVKADSASVVLEVPSEVQAGETATATMINNSSYEITYGAEYTFEYFANDEWTALKPKEGKERAWIAIAYLTQPGEEATFDFVIYPDEFTEPLQPGKYRLVKNISSDNGGVASSFKVTGEFTVIAG